MSKRSLVTDQWLESNRLPVRNQSTYKGGSQPIEKEILIKVHLKQKGEEISGNSVAKSEECVSGSH